MKKLVAILLLALSSVTMAAASNFLFLQTATKAALVKNADNSYTITLHDLSPYIGYFSDRPVREASIMPLTEFIKLWTTKKIAKNFNEVPPNAALVMMPKNSKREQHFAAEVYEPHYSNGKLIYKLNILSKKPIQTGKMSHVSLFFDDIHWNPGGF